MNESNTQKKHPKFHLHIFEKFSLNYFYLLILYVFFDYLLEIKFLMQLLE